MNLSFLAVDPAEWHDGIVRLFATNDAGVVPGWLTQLRAMPAGARPTSWIGIDEDGVVRLHVAVFPSTLSQGMSPVVVGVLASIIADRTIRTGFPAVRLFRRLLSDVRREQRFDLLIGAPNDAASPLFRLSHFADAGTIVRFVLPLGHERRSTRAAIALWRGLHRYAAGAFRRWPSVEVVASEDAETAHDIWLGNPAVARAEWTRGFSQATEPGTSEIIFAVKDQPAGQTLAQARVHVMTASAIGSIRALRHRESEPLAPMVAAVAAELRQRGIRRVEATALSDSRRAVSLRRAGFLPRGARRSLLSLALTEPGEALARILSTSDLEHADVDRW